jgi:hypothetical protein
VQQRGQAGHDCFTIESLRDIILSAKGSSSLPVLATILPVNVGYDFRAPAQREAWVEAVNVQVRALAREQNVVLADIEKAFLADRDVTRLFVDHIHPNAEGEEIISNTFLQAIAHGTRGGAAFTGEVMDLDAAAGPAGEPAAPDGDGARTAPLSARRTLFLHDRDLRPQPPHRTDQAFPGQAVRRLVRVVVDGMHPERVLAVAVESGEQVVPRDARGKAEAGDRLRDVRERVTALEADEQRPRTPRGTARRAPGPGRSSRAGRPACAPSPRGWARRTCRDTSAWCRVQPDTTPTRSRTSAKSRKSSGPSRRSSSSRNMRPRSRIQVVEVGLARLERLRADGVVQHHAVDHDVRLQGEHALEQVADGGKVVAAPAAVEDLPVPGLRPRVEQAMEHARRTCPPP